MINPFTKTSQTKRRIRERQKTGALLDRLASEYVRKHAMKEAEGCECCALMQIPNITRTKVIRGWKDLEWAHYRGKTKHSVRWDESNAAGLDDVCHRYLDQHPKVKAEFFLKLLGQEEFDQVNLRAETIMHSADMDYKLIEVYLKEKIKKLNYEK